MLRRRRQPLAMVTDHEARQHGISEPQAPSDRPEALPLGKDDMPTNQGEHLTKIGMPADYDSTFLDEAQSPDISDNFG
jgi:hypothetical protein